MNQHAILKFSPSNAKTRLLGKKVYSFDLLAGTDCPGAKLCQSFTIETPEGLRIKDGPNIQFRCFSSQQQCFYKNVYNLRKNNSQTIKSLKSKSDIFNKLLRFMPPDLETLRWHVSGDFTKLIYLEAAIELAEKFPDIRFYAYTKSLHLLQKVDTVDLSQGILRPNFFITCSFGGKYDELIEKLNARWCKVVFSRYEARKLGLKIDKDDSLASSAGGNFCLLLHGQGPANSKHSRSWQRIKFNEGGYKR